MALDIQTRDQVKEIVLLLMTRPITEEISMRVGNHKGFEHLEIVDGEWVGLYAEEGQSMGGEEHGNIEANLLTSLKVFVKQHQLGRIYPGDTDFVLEGVPEKIIYRCRPDVSFVRQENVRKTKGYSFIVPDLAVEIISPREEAGEIREKLDAYLRYGVKQVWHIYPTLQILIIYLPDGTSRTYKSAESVSGGDILVGFSLKVSELFE